MFLNSIFQFLERSLSIFAIFMCFSDLEHVLTRSLSIFRISVMIYLRFLYFLTIFDDFGGSDPYFDTVLTRCPSIFAIFAVQILWFFVKIRDFERDFEALSK